MPERALRAKRRAALAMLSDADRFRAVADYTYDWESWIDGDGVLQWVNRAVRTLTGYTVAECLAMPDYPLPIVHPVDRAYLAGVLRGARDGSRGNDLEFRVLRKDGALRWVAISWQSIRDRKRRRLGFRTSVRDIDERKRIEVRLQAAKLEAEAAARAKAELLAVASHELRTPLQSVHGHAELLLAQSTSAEQRRRITTILQQADSVLHIVDDMLTLAAGESSLSAPVRELFEPRVLVSEVLDALRPAAERKALRLAARVEGDVPQTLRGDTARVRRILFNVVGNALKFTEQGSVEVRVRRAVEARGRGQGPALVFSVRDTGIGLPETAQGIARLFEPFTQADGSIARRYGGTGLGLAIVQRLCESLGGTITASRRRPRGAVFDVQLPFERARASRTARVASEPVDAGFAKQHPCDVLVVDDSDVVRELLVERLRGLGYAPDAVDGANGALAAVGHTRYDLIVLDVQMPGIDGFVAAELLRARLPPRARTRIVALSADVLAEQHAGSRRAAFDGFLVKPVRMAELRALLRRCGAEPPRMPKPRSRNTRARGELDARVIEDLRSHRGRDGTTMLHKLVAPLVDGSAQRLAELRSAIAAHDLVHASRLAHRVRGDAAVVGALRVTALAAKLEAQLAAGDARAAGRRVDALEAALARASLALTEQLEQRAP